LTPKREVPEELLVDCADSDLACGISTWAGYLAVEGRYFFDDGLYEAQSQQDMSLIAEPKYSYSWADGHLFVAVPYLQLDSQDNERTHFDLREFYGLYVKEKWELGAGFRKIFWGVTETLNLVDIINQTDSLAGLGGSDKLGQPMISVAGAMDWGNLDFMMMPYFRERNFPGDEGRFRLPLGIDSSQAQFESSSEEEHVDVAFRYSHTIDDLDLGLSYFNGTSREPTLRTGVKDGVTPVFVPYYEQIQQAGLDTLLVAGGWLLKLETIYREGQSDSFFALTTGFEYPFTGILGTDADCSIIGEWLYDDRGAYSTTAMQNDLMVGMRLSLNDLASTVLEAGVIQDLERHPLSASLKFGRRVGDHWKVNIEGYFLHESDFIDSQFYMRRDDHVVCRLFYYF
jgi:hypothetical protein